MIVEWDLAGWNGYISSFLRIYQVGVGDVLFKTSASTPGSTSVALIPGEEYVFWTAIVGYGGDGIGYARMYNVPAPGAFAVLGLGLCTTRRRRRE